MAPSSSGVHDLDWGAAHDLNVRTLELARTLLRPTGVVLLKTFRGTYLEEFQTTVKKYFHDSRLIKPKCSRTESAEIFALLTCKQ